MSLGLRCLLMIVSFVVVAFGQPACCWWLGLIAAAGGYALFWSSIISLSRWWRFFIAMGWFSAVQAVQLFWLLSHPFWYIIGVYFFFAILLGAQFGLLSLLITPRALSQGVVVVGIAALWTLFEWIRLFVLSGFSWNPVGLALSGYVVPLQMASLWGIYGLSFWVMLVNGFAVRLWMVGWTKKSMISWLALALVPYLFGIVHLSIHRGYDKDSFASVVLVNTRFPVEELEACSVSDFMNCAKKEWIQVLQALKQGGGEKVDLVVLPEGVVPLSGNLLLYDVHDVVATFKEIFGDAAAQRLPRLQEPFAAKVKMNGQRQWLASSAYLAQAIANVYQADVIAGLEFTEKKEGHEGYVYNAALRFRGDINDDGRGMEWYAKRVLVPLGEYIPGAWLKPLTARYGIYDSYQRGCEAKVIPCQHLFIGPSICYEETIGHLVRESRLQGATMLANITNDGWFPHGLGWQHFYHARLRCVENGIPLIRACNFGVTGAVDSFGRIVAIAQQAPEDPAHALRVEVPLYTYRTWYTVWGDMGIVILCCVAVFFGLLNLHRGSWDIPCEK